MKIFEIGTGYTSIPPKIGAATEIVVQELTTSFLKMGYDVTIVDIKDKKRGINNLPIEEVNIPQIFSSTDTSLGIMHKLKRVIYSISLAHKLHGLIRKCEDKNIFIHFHNQYNLFFFLKLTSKTMRKCIKIGYTVHSHVWFGEWNDIKDLVKQRYFQEVFCCQNADKVFVLNNIVAQMLSKHYNIDSSKLEGIINGVNTDVYNGKDNNFSAIDGVRKKYNLKGKNVVFQVGSVCDRKNQMGSLKLLAPIMKEDKSLVYMYAGGIIDEGYAAQISEYATKEGIVENVHYVGEVSPGTELNRLYTIAKVTIINSKSEAFALVIAEALSARRPIFINEEIMGSLAFLGEKEGYGIIRIKETFREDLYKLLTDDDYYEEMQRKGREFIVNEFSWDVAAKQYYDIMNRI